MIDAGKVKQLTYDSVSQSTRLTATDISQACAKQRAGRAGRTRNGFCYRLYSQEQYDAMDKYTLPEILRVPLTEICLNAKMLAGELSIEQFLSKALQPPSTKNIRQSIELLKKINALDENEDITYLGIHLANMPVDCQLGKMILYAIMMRCLDPVVAIVSLLSVKDPFMLPLGNEGDRIQKIKYDFSRDSLSDHQMLLNAFDEWSKTKKSSRTTFCQDNFISGANMWMIDGVRRVIMGHLRMVQLINEDSERNVRKLNENSLRWDVVKCCLTAGMYPNVCHISMTGQIETRNKENVTPHLSSILRNRKLRGQLDHNALKMKVEWLIHGDKSCSGRMRFIKNLTIVPAIAVILFAGPIHLPESNLVKQPNVVEIESDLDCDDLVIDDWDEKPEEQDDELFSMAQDTDSDTIFKIDDGIKFIVDTDEAQLLLQLRQKFASMFARFVRNPMSFHTTHKEMNMLKVLLDVIHQEDRIERQIEKTRNEQATHGSDGSNKLSGSEAAGPSGTRRPMPQRQAVPAVMSATYNQAIQPEHKRNNKQKNKNKGNKRFDQGRNQPFYDWRQRPDSFAQAPAQSGALFNQLNAPDMQGFQNNFNSLSVAQMYDQPGPSSVSVSASDIITHRYFLLTVKNVNMIYSTVQNVKWRFNTPLSHIQEAARQTSPGMIFLIFHVQSKSSIFGCGVFRGNSKRNYNIKCSNNHFFPI